MLQLRFVALALIILAAGASALVVGTGTVYGIVMPPYEAVGTAGVAAVNGAVAAFASNSVDAAAVAASDADVQAAIQRGSLTPKAEAALLGRAGSFGAASFGLVIATDGSVKAVSGADPKLEANLAGFPVVAEALTGLARDGVVVKDDTPIHLAASPSYGADGRLAGVVLLGWPWSKELVAAVSRVAGTTTFVVTPKKVIGALPDGVDPEALKARSPFGESTHKIGPLPILLPDTARYLVSSSLLYGADPTLVAVTLTDRDGALGGIASLQAAIIIATIILLALVLGIVAGAVRAVNRPIEIITEHLSLVQQQGPSVGILAEAGLGPLLRLGKQINMLLQSMPSSRPGATAPLFSHGASSSQDVPMPTPPLAFGGAAPAAPPPTLAPPATPAAPPAPLSAPPTSSPGAEATIAAPQTPPVPASGALAGLFDDGPDPLAAFRVPAKPATPPPAPAPEPEPPQSEMNPEATVMFQVPESLLQASATTASPKVSSPPPPTPPPPAPSRAASVDDNRTVVAQVPQELLAQVAPKNHVDSADDAHYKEVYEKFVQTRIECGEDTSDLSYDRFVAKLLKNRQQILEKHKAKSVRFQVYAKDGKAALRALPVRD
jgi:hypothetical protein